MQETATVVIVAAGSSRRMLGQDKLWTLLAGRPVLAHTLDVFDASPLVEKIVLVTSADRLAETCTFIRTQHWSKLTDVVAGGARRQDSVRHGLDALTASRPLSPWVMVHDAARPFVSNAIIAAAIKAMSTSEAAVAAVPVKDTIKRVQGDLIVDTPDRSTLWAVQTPQIFALTRLLEAHYHPDAQNDVTDDATMIEHLGYPVSIFPGSYDNFKITTPEDLLFAESLIQKQLSAHKEVTL